MSDLTIPDASMRALFELWDGAYDDTEFFGAIRAIAVPVVAAELRRVADLMEGYGHLRSHVEAHQAHLLDAEALRRRADELDGGPASVDTPDGEPS